MKIYNEKYLFNQKGLLNQSLIDYYLTVGGIMINKSNAGLCNGCGKCLRKCPQHLDIPKELDKVKKEFEGHFFGFKVLFVKTIGMKIYQKFFLNNKIKSDKYETRRNIGSMPKMRFKR